MSGSPRGWRGAGLPAAFPLSLAITRLMAVAEMPCLLSLYFKTWFLCVSLSVLHLLCRSGWPRTHTLLSSAGGKVKRHHLAQVFLMFSLETLMFWLVFGPSFLFLWQLFLLGRSGGGPMDWPLPHVHFDQGHHGSPLPEGVEPELDLQSFGCLLQSRTPWVP